MSNKLIDMTGQRYGRLTVIGRYPQNSINNKPLWECKCDCGNVVLVNRRRLKDGMTKSCGCYRRDLSREQHTTHGKSKNGKNHNRLYRIWSGMKDRCCNPKSKYWSRYGGAGITICDEWKNDYMKFDKWAMSNGYQDDLTIDRIENSKGYSPDNCRWATYMEQENNRTNNILYQVNNEILTLSELSRKEQLSRALTASKHKEDLLYGK